MHQYMWVCYKLIARGIYIHTREGGICATSERKWPLKTRPIHPSKPYMIGKEEDSKRFTTGGVLCWAKVGYYIRRLSGLVEGTARGHPTHDSQNNKGNGHTHIIS